jgi:ubiquinone biosynthesis protein UbiJ
MASTSPLSFLQDFFQNFSLPGAPAWAVDEAQRKCILALNHVLMQEPQAMERLVRQSGRVVVTQWRAFRFAIRVTPAGLLDLADGNAAPDLTLVLTEESPLKLAKHLLQGEKPPVRIEGDVQLAAEVNWLVDNVRWDAEEDLSRILGDAPAHLVAQAGSKMAAALRDFVGRAPKSQAGSETRGGNSA